MTTETSLEEILKRSEGEEHKAVWPRERDEIHQSVNRLQEPQRNMYASACPFRTSKVYTRTKPNKYRKLLKLFRLNSLLDLSTLNFEWQ